MIATTPAQRAAQLAAQLITQFNNQQTQLGQVLTADAGAGIPAQGNQPALATGALKAALGTDAFAALTAFVALA